MIKVNGIALKDCLYENQNLDYLLCGEVNSASMSFMKTPLHVYGKNIDELVELAKAIKEQDASYDTLDIYSELDIDDREFLNSKRI